MYANLEVDPERLKIFHELQKRRIYVGELHYNQRKNLYHLIYDDSYFNLKTAIPLGPELDLSQQEHFSQGKLFPSFYDRIPDRDNPAYPDYCYSEFIDVNETNPIILLGSIGKRGPSTFVFEKTFKTGISIQEIINIRKKLNITQHDFALAFDISEVTWQKIESGLSMDPKTIKILTIYFTFPDVALWQLRQTGCTIHSSVRFKLFAYVHQLIKQKLSLPPNTAPQSQ